MAENRPIRILLADDHIVVRLGLVSIIHSKPDMRVVAEAVSGEQAIELYRQHRPDLVLMDLRMPGLDGVEAMRALRGEFREARFLVLTTYRRDEDIYRALTAGASGYILKSASSDELISAIRAVSQGQRYIPPAIAARLAERMPILELSARELDVLRLICKGFANKEIASRLGIAEHTVKNHVANILDKMGAEDRTQAAVYALERGLVELGTAE
jgi:two-component system, NarL family, response regulator